MIGSSRTTSKRTDQTLKTVASVASRMPAPKSVSARSQSPAHSYRDEGAKTTTNGTNLPVGEHISTRDWSVESLLVLGAGTFEEVERVSVRKMPPQRIVEVVRKYEELGRPLILEEWHLRKEWDEDILNVDYLVRELADQGGPCLLSIYVEPQVNS